QVAFLGGAYGHYGIFATDRSGTLHRIVGTGDVLEVAPGDFRTVDSRGIIRFSAGGFNDLGQVAFSALFTDGSSGIFVSNAVAVPEPSAVLLLAIGLAGAIALRQQFIGARRLFAIGILGVLWIAPHSARADSAVAWGANSSGQLGNDSGLGSDSAVEVNGLT